MLMETNIAYLYWSRPLYENLKIKTKRKRAISFNGRLVVNR